MKSLTESLLFLANTMRSICTGILVFSALVIVLPATCLAAEQQPAAEPSVSGTEQPESKEETYDYKLEGRKDPFVPFITEKATTSEVDMDEIVEKEVELTGMQLFEPGQLKLVALMKKSGQDFAMVEDFTGKGYVITEGTKIGKRGVVKDIVPNKVIIEETAETRAGKKIVTTTAMVLKKEGEE